jgi:hypothetical protein
MGTSDTIPPMSPENATLQPARSAGALGMLLLGAAVVAGAWLLPVQIRSLSPLLLREAGAGSVSLVESGERLLESERPGPAALIRDAAASLGLPAASTLDADLRRTSEERPELAAWGAWDPFLEPVFGAAVATAPAGGERGVLVRFLPGSARSAIKGYLANTRSAGVKAVVATASIDKSSRFIPAGRAGGQPLEATILLAAMLMQGNHLSPDLAREVRAMAEASNRDGDLAPIEEFYFDLLSAGRRLDWGQLTEWLRTCPNPATLGEFAHLLKVAPDRTAVLYSASVVTGMPREVMRYAMSFGSAGVDGIAESLRHGEGAVRQLLLRQVPVNPDVPMALEFLAGLSLRYSLLLTIAKYLGFACGVWLAFRGLDRALMGPVGRGAGRMMMHAPQRRHRPRVFRHTLHPQRTIPPAGKPATRLQNHREHTRTQHPRPVAGVAVGGGLDRLLHHHHRRLLRGAPGARLPDLPPEDPRDRASRCAHAPQAPADGK